MCSLIRKSLKNLNKAILIILLSIVGYIVAFSLGYKIVGRLILLVGIVIGFWLSPGLLIILLAVVVGYAALLINARVPSSIENVRQLMAVVREERKQPLIIVREYVIDAYNDIFQDRIVNQNEIENIINDLQIVYSSYSKESDFEDFPRFIRVLFKEITEILSDPEKLAPIITDAFIITPATSIGFAIGRYMIRKIKNWSSQKPDNRYSSQLVEKLERLLTYFQVTPRSRLAEITMATGLSVEEARALLRLGPFTHEAGCFWRIADLDIELPP
jgi:hypothetical protein